MKCIKNKIIPFGKYKAINLFGIVLYKGDTINSTTVNHEYIHTLQMRELGYIGFYLLYILEWIIKGFSYSSISFEKEAYKYQFYDDYPNSRKHYNMWRN